MFEENRENRFSLKHDDPIAQFETRVMLYLLTDEKYFRSCVNYLNQNTFDFFLYRDMLCIMKDAYEKKGAYLNFYDVFGVLRTRESGNGMSKELELCFVNELYELMRNVVASEEEIVEDKNRFNEYIIFQAERTAYAELGKLIVGWRNKGLPSRESIKGTFEKTYRTLKDIERLFND